MASSALIWFYVIACVGLVLTALSDLARQGSSGFPGESLGLYSLEMAALPFLFVALAFVVRLFVMFDKDGPILLFMLTSPLLFLLGLSGSSLYLRFNRDNPQQRFGRAAFVANLVAFGLSVFALMNLRT